MRVLVLSMQIRQDKKDDDYEDPDHVDEVPVQGGTMQRPVRRSFGRSQGQKQNVRKHQKPRDDVRRVKELDDIEDGPVRIGSRRNIGPRLTESKPLQAQKNQSEDDGCN